MFINILQKISYMEKIMNDLRIVCMDNILDIGIKVDEYLKEKNITSQDEDDDDDTKEQDLFNLIDTMYQNKEDED